MSATEADKPVEARPACDNCKARKTKCDRQSPCASCVTLKVPCRHTRRASEKRQRVLISSRYEDALQDVGRQMAEVKGLLQTLVAGGDGSLALPSRRHRSPAAGVSSLLTPGSSGRGEAAATSPSARTMIDEQVPTLSGVHEGYNGDSSFQSHAYRIENALETLAASELLKLAAPPISDNARHLTPPPAAAVPSIEEPSSQGDTLEFENLPLPPMDAVLRLLRLAHTDKQRFFIDFQLFTEDEFAAVCRDVYFATRPVSLTSWISCNVGLYFLFVGLEDDAVVRIGSSSEDVQGYCRVLMGNAEEAMKSLRLCSEPSLELCRSMALLATFYVKLGHSTVAWRLISGAARAALDLGLHRLPGDPDEQQRPDPFAVFWYIYSWDKGLAMTCGRAPTIHHYDVTTRGPETVLDRHDVPTRVYCAFIEFAIVTGEIQRDLFSARAHRSSHTERMQHVHGFAARLNALQESVRGVQDTDFGYSRHFRTIIDIIDIYTYSLLAMVYRLVPPPASTPSHPLQCSDGCVDAARKALEALVRIGEPAVKIETSRLDLLLNTILSLVPFVSFIILAGNAIATSSSADLTLLSSILAILSPATEMSPLVRKIHDACERFYQIASVIVSAATVRDTGITVNPAQTQMDRGAILGSQGQLPGVAGGEEQAFGFPMALEDWDSVMLGYESELGNSFDARALTDIIEPYISNSGW